jgi:hypothetical protein
MDILPESPVCSISFPLEDVAGLYAGKLKPGPSWGPVFCAIANRDARCAIKGQEFLRSDDGIRHALCIFDPAFAKRVRELGSKAGQ